jgi:HAD superfamily hydrolase (TIGR01509 family)
MPATAQPTVSRPRRASHRAAPPRPAPTPAPEQPLDLDRLASCWQRALDAEDRALRAAGGELPPALLARGRRALALERIETSDLLGQVARASGVREAPWLSPVQVTPALLGLPVTARACLFDVEGVLTDSPALHAWAWGTVFDDLLLGLANGTRWEFVPFDPDADYREYIEGRSRTEGAVAFLESRGVRLQPHAVDELTRRKGEALAAALDARGVRALPGVRRYLEAAGRAGVRRAVVSASSSTLAMLELAALARFAEARVDAEAIRTEGLRSAPAPDVVLAACRRLGIEPADAVAFTHTQVGVAAARAAGATVVAVGESPRLDGADRVVPSLGALLDPRLRDGFGAD